MNSILFIFLIFILIIIHFIFALKMPQYAIWWDVLAFIALILIVLWYAIGPKIEKKETSWEKNYK